MSDITEDTADEFEIEIQDDTPEEDRPYKKAAEEKAEKPEKAAEPAAGADEDDLEGYSDKVKKRISKLKYDYHEERRAREESARIEREAVEYARRLQEENTRLQKVIQDGEGIVLSQAKQRLTVQLEQAKQAYMRAYEAGDAAAVADAQLKMTELKAEEMRLQTFKPRAPQPQQQFQPQAQPQVQQAPAQPQVPQPDPRAQRWAQENAWFGKDDEMTALAFGVHERLVKSGVAPTSEEYYNKIDEAMRRRFPDKFGVEVSEEKAPSRPAGNVVAPGGRNTGKAPRKVVLTSSAVALAKRLGLTPEQYAAQLLKDGKNG